MESAEKNGRWLPRLALYTLIVYTSLAAIIMRKSRDVPSDQLYSPAASVLFGELLKIFVSIYLHDGFQSQQEDLDRAEKGHKPQEPQMNLWNRMKLNGKDIYSNASWKMSIPASLYVLQNCLQIHSISIITAVEYQALSQLKIIAIGVFSILLLKKKLLCSHWMSMATLLVGVIIIQASKALQGVSQETLSSAVDQLFGFRQNLTDFIPNAGTLIHLTGTFSAVFGCVFGSYAGVYMEKVFKSGRKGLWSSNAELSFFSLLPASVLVLLHMYKVQSWNIFQNFGLWAWVTVITRGLGGIIVALVLKHCDNILKAFATSAAIVLSMAIKAVWDGELPNTISMLGASIVIFSSVSYANVDKKAKMSSLIRK